MSLTAASHRAPGVSVFVFGDAESVDMFEDKSEKN